jgi:hypothetical protein
MEPLELLIQVVAAGPERIKKAVVQVARVL